jgi:hypothetical protein
MQALMLALMVPLMLLNMLSGVVGGVWLATRGEWALIGGGVAYMLIGALLVSLALLPGSMFAAPALALLNRGRVVIAAIVGLPGALWTHAVLAAACVVVFFFVTANPDWRSLWPYLLWGHAVALAPWAYLANKDEQAGNQNAQVPLFFAGLGLLSMMIGVLMNGGPLTAPELALWFAPFFVLGVLAHVFIMFVEAASAKRELAFFESRY